jgi:hypothetical protein
MRGLSIYFLGVHMKKIALSLLVLMSFSSQAGSFSACYDKLRDQSFNKLAAAEHCEFASSGFSACYDKLRSESFNKLAAANHCEQAKPSFSSCYDKLRSESFRKQAAVDYCDQKIED